MILVQTDFIFGNKDNWVLTHYFTTFPDVTGKFVSYPELYC